MTKEFMIIPLHKDFMYKYIFTKKKEKLMKFLIAVLKINIDYKSSTIVVENNELGKAKAREYHKTVDLLVTLNSEFIIDVEINSEHISTIKFRNMLYLNKITTNYVEKGTKVTDMNKISFI